MCFSIEMLLIQDILRFCYIQRTACKHHLCCFEIFCLILDHGVNIDKLSTKYENYLCIHVTFEPPRGKTNNVVSEQV